MVRTSVEFASRHAFSGYSYNYRVAYDFALPGWGARSQWGQTGTDPWVRLRHDTDRSHDTDLWVEPRGTSDRSLLLPLLVDELDVEPEDAVRALGLAPAGLLRRRAVEIARALTDAPEPAESAPGPTGHRAALTWLAGRSEQRPGSDRAWTGGEPDAHQVDAERAMAAARLKRGGLPPGGAVRLASVRDTLARARFVIGPMHPQAGETERWLRRRLRRLPDDPAPDVPAVRGASQGPDGGQSWGPRVIRAQRFRSWLVLNATEVIGRVEPLDSDRWTATDPDGRPVDDDVHPTMSDAAIHVVATALTTGRITFDEPD